MRLAWLAAIVPALLSTLLSTLAAAAAGRFAVVEVRVNGIEQAPTVVWVAQSGDVHVKRDDALNWRLDARAVPGQVLNNTEYIRLSALPGVTTRLDASMLTVTAEGAAFPRVNVDLLRQGMQPWEGGRGAYVNYDASTLIVGSQRPASGITMEGVAYAEALALVATGVATDTAAGRRFVRYETSLRRDFPESTASLIVGDAVSRGGTQNNSFRFGGISYGTDFSTRPDLVTFALPVVSGESRVPTVGDLLVNGQPRGRLDLPAGPFEITNVPAINGAGQIQLLTRDVLGRQQVTAMPFYVSTALLSPGLTDGGFEAGKVRENFGSDSTRYGRGFARGALRGGITPALTLEGYMEGEGSRHGAGVGATALLGGAALGHVMLARSGGETQGSSAFAFVERTSDTVSGRLSVERATRDFSRLGGVPALHHRVQFNASAALGSLGSVGVVYAADAPYDQEETRTYAATYQNRIFNQVSMVLSHGVMRRGGETRQSTSLLFSMPLGARSSAMLSTTESNGRETVFDFNQSPPQDEGWAVRGRLAQGSRSRAEAGVTWQTPQVQWLAELGKATRESSALRLGASGSFVMAGGAIRPVRQLGDAFAIVSVPGLEGIDVYRNNLRVASTDSSGFAVIPRLRAYEPNTISVDTLQLTLSREIRMPRRTVVPARRGGVVMQFESVDTRGAFVRAVLDDGSPVPAGATLTLRGRAFAVAAKGDAYVTGLDEGGEALVEWPGQRCTMRVPPTNITQATQRIGPLNCRRMQ